MSEHRNGHIVANHDLLLDVGYETTHPQADYVSKRLGKMDQAIELTRIAEAVGATWFIPVPVLSKRPNPGNIYDLHHLPDHVLIKSTDGARGVGHVIFDTTKASMFKFLNDLRNLTPDRGAQDVLEKYKDAIEVHTGQSNYDSEVAFTLTSHQLMVTALVRGVTSEVRVVLNAHSEACLIKQRERKNNVDPAFDKQGGYQQATGANRDHSTLYYELESVCADVLIRDEIWKVLKQLPPLNSVDLFFTTKGWGIFEYCNQFGTEAFDIEDSVNLHMGLLSKLYLQKFKPE
ncbi:hypothetical protein D3C75_865500 [compost metagenome]